MSRDVLTVIATRNRPESLSRALASLARQVEEPGLIVVCDSSDAPHRGQVRQVVLAHSGPVEIVESAERSLTRQKNLAIQRGLVRGEFNYVLVIDDDTEPSPDFISMLRTWLEQHPEAVGVSGVTHPRWTRPHRGAFLDRIFRWCGYDTSTEGGITKAGIGVPIDAATTEPVRVQWLIGCSMWRAEVFSSLSYFPEYVGSALGEDVEFSYRAGQLGELWVLPRAVLGHALEGSERPDTRMHARRFVRNRWVIVREMRESGSRSAFWMTVGLSAVMAGARLAKASRNADVRCKEAGTLRGTLEGSIDVVLRRPCV